MVSDDVWDVSGRWMELQQLSLHLLIASLLRTRTTTRPPSISISSLSDFQSEIAKFMAFFVI
eukprot:gene967-4211_t